MAQRSAKVMRVREVLRIGVQLLDAGAWAAARAQFELAADVSVREPRGRFNPYARVRRLRRPLPGYSSSLETGLEILGLLVESRGPASVAGIAERLELPRSTVHRYLSTLVRCGYATQEGVAGHRYRLTFVDLPELPGA